ncbi:transglutaminase family protein [Brachybacterium sacelli]|uniref:Transglutaminase-like putative cysteine protease n=1 Tax=Brachybacterium sacelli TaxID=173364 RepID=A0ABS4X040_9MICO|nr:transglutaminase family protein [Brachybacterium sacelli]MBP2381831.1 transglutaminase-like putative cysteine protease [Brachybacterium sacelli]
MSEYPQEHPETPSGQPAPRALHEQSAPDASGAPSAPVVPLRLEEEAAAEAVDYRVHHLTSYRYAKPVSRNYGRAHVEPRATPHQRVLSHEVVVDPSPARLTAHTDFYGNSSTYLLVDDVHDRLDVHSHAHVTVSVRRYAAEAMSRPWEQCTAENWGQLLPAEGIDFVHLSPRVPALAAARELSAAVFTPERPIGECLAELTALIHSDFTYDSGATTVTSTLAEVLAARHGVCQDFSHVGVAAVRAAGLAARYVSGYLRTAPSAEGALGTRPAGEMIGSAASHAWLSVLVPGTGWVDIDPTNRTFVDQRFVTTAWGRDYADVPPLKGIVVGPPGATSTLDVAVGVVPVTTGGSTPE